MTDMLAEQHDCSARDITFSAGRVSGPDFEHSFADVARMTWEARISLSATGFYKTPDIEWDRIAGKGRPFFYFAYGAACTEVVIDTLTGENRILRVNRPVAEGLDVPIDEIEVRWPSGTVDEIPNPDIDQYIDVVEGAHPPLVDPFEVWRAEHKRLARVLRSRCRRRGSRSLRRP